MSRGLPLNVNLTAERPTFVTHLECGLTGARYDADVLHGLSDAGRPLLVRYDLAGVGASLDKAALGVRPRDLWRWRDLVANARTARNRPAFGRRGFSCRDRQGAGCRSGWPPRP